MKILLNDNRIFLIAGIFLLLISVNSVVAQTEKEMAAIRHEVAAINKSASKYKTIKKDVEDISIEGTEAIYYFAAEDLRKITAKIYGETYNATGEFYYLKGRLIFAFLKNNRYATSIGAGGSPKVARTEEQRFYFAGDRLIRLLVGRKELKSTDERYSRLKEEISGISSKLKES